MLKPKELISVLIITIVVFLFCSVFLVNISNMYYETEWLTNCSYQAFNLKSIIEFKQFPFWSPFFGGGYPFIGHPENLCFSPLFIPFLFFGEWVGYKLFFLVGYVLGAWGMFYLTRKVLKYSLWGAAFSSLLFTMTSFFPYHMHSGNLYLANFLYFPLLFSFYIKAENNKLFMFYTSLILAFLLINGIALYWLTIILFLTLWSMFKSVDFSQKKLSFEPRYLKKWLIIVILAILFGAVKIFPLFEIIAKNIRAFDNYDAASAYSLNLGNFYLSLFSRGPYKKPMDWFPNGDYADPVMYFGFFPVVLCLLSFLVYRKEKEVKINFIILIIFIMLSMGKNSPIDIFKWIWHIPLFHSVHDPNRYFPFVILFIISLLAGKMFNYFSASHKIIKGAAIILMIFSLNDMFWANRKYQENLFVNSPPPVSPEKTFYQVKTYNQPVCARGSISHKEDSYQYFWLLRNVGKIDWVADLNLEEKALPKYYVNEQTGERKLNPDYQGEIYFLDKSSKARISFFSPHKIFIEAEIQKPDQLIINQNHSRDWRTNIGQVNNFNGLLSIFLEKKGKYLIKLSYRPLIFYLGLIVSLFSIMISIIILGKRRINDKVIKRQI